MESREAVPVTDRGRLSVAFLCAIAASSIIARPARAHTLGISRGEYACNGTEVRATMDLRRDEAALAVHGLDANGDGELTPSEVDRAKRALQATFLDSLDVAADGEPCPGHLEGASIEPPDGLRIVGTYRCAHAPMRLRMRFGFLDRMPGDHRHLATLHLPAGRGDIDTLATLANPFVDEEITSARPSHGFASLVRSGIVHILTGADHLAFLLALVLGATLIADERARIGPLVAMLTAFTVGHSASLALATLGVFAPGARLVEPAVALSVAYVGAENLFARSVKHRWMITLPFGVVHGFAFAGALLPLGLPRAQLPLALFAFNLGVEIGQLLVLGLLVPVLAPNQSRAWYPRTARALSIGVAVAGLAWFVERIAGRV